MPNRRRYHHAAVQSKSLSRSHEESSTLFLWLAHALALFLDLVIHKHKSKEQSIIINYMKNTVFLQIWNRSIGIGHFNDRF